MAKCGFCDREMKQADSCTKNIIALPTQLDNVSNDGTFYHAIPYGDEDKPGLDEYDPEGRCHDCGVAIGGFHHVGCDWEESPIPDTHNQLLSAVLQNDPMDAPLHGRLDPDPHADISMEEVYEND